MTLYHILPMLQGRASLGLSMKRMSESCFADDVESGVKCQLLEAELLPRIGHFLYDSAKLHKLFRNLLHFSMLDSVRYKKQTHSRAHIANVLNGKGWSKHLVQVLPTRSV
jgi:hypothetical protein